MGLIETTSGWWEFEGDDDEPPGLFFSRPDEGGEPEVVGTLLRVVDDGPADTIREQVDHR